MLSIRVKRDYVLRIRILEDVVETCLKCGTLTEVDWVYSNVNAGGKRFFNGVVAGAVVYTNNVGERFTDVGEDFSYYFPLVVKRDYKPRLFGQLHMVIVPSFLKDFGRRPTLYKLWNLNHRSRALVIDHKGRRMAAKHTERRAYAENRRQRRRITRSKDW